VLDSRTEKASFASIEPFSESRAAAAGRLAAPRAAAALLLDAATLIYNLF
jgi:hypothetical protein